MIFWFLLCHALIGLFIIMILIDTIGAWWTLGLITLWFIGVVLKDSWKAENTDLTKK